MVSNPGNEPLKCSSSSEKYSFMHLMINKKFCTSQIKMLIMFNPSNFFASRGLIPGNIRVIFPSFQNRACCEKHLKDDKHSSLHLARKCARIIFLRHYLFLEANSFPRKSVRFSDQRMSGNNYSTTFRLQITAIVYIASSIPYRFFNWV